MGLPIYPGFRSVYLTATPLTGRTAGDNATRSYLRLNASFSSYIDFGTSFTPSAGDMVISCKVRLG